MFAHFVTRPVLNSIHSDVTYEHTDGEKDGQAGREGPANSHFATFRFEHTEQMCPKCSAREMQDFVTVLGK